MKIKIFTILLITHLSVLAQQDAQYTQYMLNTVNINPAYAGTRGSVNILALHRSQWVGLDGAPTTNTFSINAPLGETKLGLGAAFINDAIGPINSNSVSVDLSYTIDLNYDYRLSFGVKANANIFNFDINKLNPSELSDLHLQSIKNDFKPNFGTGIYLHSDKSYVGLSVRNMLNTTNYSDVAVYKERLNYYLIAGHVFDVAYATQFKPTVLAKAVRGAPLQIDVSGNFLFDEKITIGAAYRWSAAVSAQVGFQLSNQLYIGYGYDFETTSLSRYNSGSHEIFIRYEIFKSFNRVTAPRFF